MGHTVRTTAKRPKAFWETIHERMKVGQAVTVVNNVLDGKDVPPTQAGMAWNVINKFTPNLMAVQMSVEHKADTSILDLQAQALEVGIDPSMLLPEKTESAEESPGDPPTPDCERDG